jgi:hypothetical protein
MRAVGDLHRREQMRLGQEGRYGSLRQEGRNQNAAMQNKNDGLDAMFGANGDNRGEPKCSDQTAECKRKICTALFL